MFDTAVEKISMKPWKGGGRKKREKRGENARWDNMKWVAESCELAFSLADSGDC
jgi:hypothetical protein